LGAKEKRTTEYLTLDEKMKAVTLHEKKLEMLPDDVSKREKALLQNTKDEIEKILTWGKELLSSPDFLKAKMTDDGISLSFKIKNTSGLDFEYIRIPFLLYDAEGQLIEQIIFQKDNWTDGKVRESQRLLACGVPVRGSIDFRNIVYLTVQPEIPEEDDDIIEEEPVAGNDFKLCEEFMDNNSFDIVVEQNFSEAEDIKESVTKEDREESPVGPSGKRKNKGLLILIIICVIIAGLITLGVTRHRNHVQELATKAWEERTDDSAMFSFAGYDSMKQSEQLKVDSRFIIYLIDEKNEIKKYADEEYEFYDVILSYVKQSKGGYQDRAREISDALRYCSFGLNLTNTTGYIEKHLYHYAVEYYLDEIEYTPFMAELVENAYPDEMIEGCLRIVVTDREDYRYNGHEQYFDYGYYKDETIQMAKEWLTEHDVDYESVIEDFYVQMDEKIAEDVAAKEAEKTKVDSDETADNGSSSGGGGGTSGRWKPNSGSGTGGSGTIYNSGSGSGSGSFGAGSGSTPKTNPNGWADYDEGYDDVMYNDEYDEERYQTDSEYASGVDDARDEYEEVYGEEFD